MQETLNTCHRIYLLHVPVLLQMLCGLSLVCVLYFTLFVFLYECACPNHCEQQFRQQAAKKNQRLLLTVQLVAHQTTMIRPSNHCAFWQFMGGGMAAMQPWWPAVVEWDLCDEKCFCEAALWHQQCFELSAKACVPTLAQCIMFGVVAVMIYDGWRKKEQIWLLGKFD